MFKGTLNVLDDLSGQIWNQPMSTNSSQTVMIFIEKGLVALMWSAISDAMGSSIFSMKPLFYIAMNTKCLHSSKL